VLRWALTVARFRNLCTGVLALGLLGSAACSNEPPDDGTMPFLTVPADLEPTVAPMRRLLSRHYLNTVELVFGPDAALVATPPHDLQLNGFESIAASQLSMTDDLVMRYEQSARAVATAAMADTARIQQLIGCDPADNTVSHCYQSFIRRAGRLLFRRPLTDDELTDYRAVAETADDQMGGFHAGVQWVIVAMLQSPNFLFQVEVGEPVAGGDHHQLTAYELASRMAFFLLDEGPDDELLTAAENGKLDTRNGIRAVAHSLLERAAARRATSSFFTEYLRLNQLDDATKDPAQFPNYSAELADSMKSETLKLLNDIVYDREASMMEMFTADYTFVDDRLAEHYGIAGPLDGVEWTKATLPIEQKRPGVLGHASTATAQSHADSTSVTHRGLFVVESFLCSTMPPAPDDVVTELPPSSVAPTMRERVAVHLEDPACASCHQISDPVGLALENLDPVGIWRDRENGETIDTAAEHYQLGSFDGIVGLASALASSPETSLCFVRQLYRYATGHVETKGELGRLQQLNAEFERSDHRFKDLMVDMVSSDLFRTIEAPSIEEATE